MSYEELSHIMDETKMNQPHPSAICGKGWGAKGHPSLTTVSFPSINALPTCRQCREIFLNKLGVQINPQTGYPL